MEKMQLWEDASSVKQEECEDDKVHVYETTIIAHNFELQDHVLHGKLKHYEVSSLDNIKTEFILSEGQYSITDDSVKIEKRFNSDDTKIELDNGVLYCEHCSAYYEDYCIKCGMLVHIMNKNNLNNANNNEREDLPNDILEVQEYFEQLGIFALKFIPEGVKFGPFIGLCKTESLWKIKGGKFVVDKDKSSYLNWMKYVNHARNIFERNLIVFQSEDHLYYRSTRPIHPGDELLVYFGEEYENSLNGNVEVDFILTTKHIIEDAFACTFCCLGFRLKSHLAKHKTSCLRDTAAVNFSIEELTQCLFCKIYLSQKEYLGYHLPYCYERNVRKCIPSTSTSECVKEHGPKKRYQIFKCDQCNYRTKYKADIKKHTNNQHYKVKTYKSGICNRLFKTKGSLRLDVENIHIYASKKEDQSHGLSKYMSANIKLEAANSQLKKNRCFLCDFHTKYKHCLRNHIKTRHLKEFDYKCDKCEFRTNRKHHLNTHTKTKHLNEIDYRCDKCEFKTRSTNSLKAHIKTAHLNVFDYKCESCEFRTNRKNHLKHHIKTIHLKELDYKCDTCEYRTSGKSNLECHRKAKHLKEFDYKCEKCELRTNHKLNFEIHVKTKHLNEFDYKCGKCEFRTNRKKYFEEHTKTKHLKEFDYNCDKCELRTNRKKYYEEHTKTKHLKEFDYKCESCEFQTNIKVTFKRHIRREHLIECDYKCDLCEFRTHNNNDLEDHIKTKHLKEFDYNCDKCEFRTNVKSKLVYHIKVRHLKQFDYECDECEFKTCYKCLLERHIKTKHLNEFDYKCDSCKYKTNTKANLKKHIKTKHLNEFDYKCDKCEFKTNVKSKLVYHMKSRHL